MGPSGRFTYVIVILMFGTGYMQVLYLSRAFRTKVTLPDFCEKCRVTRHSRVFRGLTGSQQTPGFGASHCYLDRSNIWVLAAQHEPEKGRFDDDGLAAFSMIKSANSWNCLPSLVRYLPDL